MIDGICILSFVLISFYVLLLNVAIESILMVIVNIFLLCFDFEPNVEGPQFASVTDASSMKSTFLSVFSHFSCFYLVFPCFLSILNQILMIIVNIY